MLETLLFSFLELKYFTGRYVKTKNGWILNGNFSIWQNNPENEDFSHFFGDLSRFCRLNITLCSEKWRFYSFSHEISRFLCHNIATRTRFVNNFLFNFLNNIRSLCLRNILCRELFSLHFFKSNVQGSSLVVVQTISFGHRPNH